MYVLTGEEYKSLPPNRKQNNNLYNKLYIYFKAKCENQNIFPVKYETLNYDTGLAARSQYCVSAYAQVKSGFVMNIMCIIIVLVATHTWGMIFFDLRHVPWQTTTQVINSTTPHIPI